MATAVCTGMPTEKVHVIHKTKYETIPEFFERVGKEIGEWIPAGHTLNRDYAVDIRILLEEGDY